MSAQPPFPIPPGLEFETDVSVGAWIDPLMLPADWNPGVRAGAIVPPGFDAYARVFHPGRRRDGTSFRWADIAAERGTTVHPQMQFSHVFGVHRFDRIDEINPPPEGCMPQADTAVLASILESHTTTAERCWFAMWDGYGWGDPERRSAEELERIPNLRVRGRRYYLLRGPVGSASRLEVDDRLFQSASLWWPDDRAWCVATSIDGDSTYVAGGRTCIRAVLDDERLEALPATVEDRFDAWGDEINPRPPGFPEYRRPMWTS
jgi:hypothetical protein